MDDEERALLTACAAAPADDLPRLVYADWLDEHARYEQAAVVRLQVAAARPDTHPVRGRELLAQADAQLVEYAPDWERPLRALGATEVGYHRGLPVTATFPAHRLAAVGDRLFDVAPTVTHLRLTADDPAHARAAVAGVGLARLTGVTVQAAGLGDAGAALLAANPHAAALRHLAVRWDTLGDAGAAALAHSPHLAGLDRLDLFANRLSAHGVRLLLSGSGLPALAELDLGDNPLGDAGARAIAAAPATARLTRLNLRGTGVRLAGLRALAASPHLGDDLVISTDDFPAGRVADFRDWVRRLGGGPSGGRGR